MGPPDAANRDDDLDIRIQAGSKSSRSRGQWWWCAYTAPEKGLAPPSAQAPTFRFEKHWYWRIHWLKIGRDQKVGVAIKVRGRRGCWAWVCGVDKKESGSIITYVLDI